MCLGYRFLLCRYQIHPIQHPDFSSDVWWGKKLKKGGACGWENRRYVVGKKVEERRCRARSPLWKDISMRGVRREAGSVIMSPIFGPTVWAKTESSPILVLPRWPSTSMTSPRRSCLLRPRQETCIWHTIRIKSTHQHSIRVSATHNVCHTAREGWYMAEQCVEWSKNNMSKLRDLS